MTEDKVAESRTVQETSGGTFLLSLPKIWCMTHNIQKKDELLVSYTKSGSLTVTPKKLSQAMDKREVILVESPLLSRMILQHYLEGYTVIKIKASDSVLHQKEEIRQLARHLIGIEILRETQKEMELHFIIEESSGSGTTIDPFNYLERAFSISLEMLQDAVAAFVLGDVAVGKEIVNRDNEVNRIYFLLVRLLKTILFYQPLTSALKPVECLDFRVVASFAEEMGDKAAYLASLAGTKPYIIEKSDPLTEKIRELGKSTLENISAAVEAYINKTVEKSQEYRVTAANLINTRKEIEKKFIHGTKTNLAFLELLQVITRLNDITIDMCDLII